MAAQGPRGKPVCKKLAVIIPALNEEESVGQVVQRAYQSLSHEYRLRIVVCDNGSTDGTSEKARRAGAEVLSEPKAGYGNACLRGIDAVADWADAFLFLDADGSSRPEEAPYLVLPVVRGESDLTLGVRPRSAKMTLPQKFGTTLAVALVNRRWNVSFSDMGPFRCISREGLSCLPMKDRTWGWTIEMQILAVTNGLRIQEVPVTWNLRLGGKSKISGTLQGVIRAGFKILWTVGRYSIRMKV